MESPGPGGPRWFERAPLKPLATFDEDFEPLGAEIGRGASGIVKRSVRRSDGAAVAVKVIDVQKLRVTNAFSTTRMRREVDVMLGLRHRNIVELHGAYADDDRVWLVMELVTGGELFEAILARGAFSEDAARPIARELASAVAFMHSRGVIHRDLKPENVLVDAAGHVKLVDFGLSKLVTGGGSAARTMVGTPSYLAPEIEGLRALADSRSIDLDALGGSEDHILDLAVGAATYDEQVDAWSLGVTLYVMLVARFPVYRRDDAGNVVGVEPRPLRAFSDDAQSLLTSLLCADPKNRLSVRDALGHRWLHDDAPPAAEQAVALSPPHRRRTQPDEAAAAEPRVAPSPRASPRSAPTAITIPRLALSRLAGARAGALAAATVRLPPALRRAGLAYHERAVASRALATKLRGTAVLVLETVDDVRLAAAAGEPAAVKDLLESMRRWTADLARECAAAKDANLCAMRDCAPAADPAADHESLFAEIPRRDANDKPRNANDKPRNANDKPRNAKGRTESEEDAGTGFVDEPAECETPAKPPAGAAETPETAPATTTPATATPETAPPATAPPAAPPSAAPRRRSSPSSALALLELCESDDDVPAAAADASRAPPPPGAPAAAPGPASQAPAQSLVKGLGELHAVFARMELFWADVGASLETVLRRTEALAVLAQVAAKPQLRQRFDQRLEQFETFWTGLADWDLEAASPRQTATTQPAD